MIVKCVYWLARYDIYFGEHAMGYVNWHPQGPLKDLAYLLYRVQSSWAALALILAVLALCLLNPRLKIYFITDAILWLLVVNLQNRIYPTLTSGDFLLNQFLIANCFFSLKEIKGDDFFTSLKTFLHNVSLTAIIAQICLAYFVAGLAKLGDSEWMQGTAMQTSMGIHHFGMYDSFKTFPIFMAIPLNYIVMFYQLFFSVLVWIRPVKKIFLVIGILMHLYIAFVLGLISFGFIMILSYVFFWPMKPHK